MTYPVGGRGLLSALLLAVAPPRYLSCPVRDGRPYLGYGAIRERDAMSGVRIADECVCVFMYDDMVHSAHDANSKPYR